MEVAAELMVGVAVELVVEVAAESNGQELQE